MSTETKDETVTLESVAKMVVNANLMLIVLFFIYGALFFGTFDWRHVHVNHQWLF